MADPFDDVIGQPVAVELLRRAAAAPVHAYLFVGATGWGTRSAARAFAGELLAAAGEPGGEQRSRELAAAEHHPSLFVFERVGASINKDQAAEIVRRASLSPPEGRLQVIVLVDFHLVSVQAPRLLKTIEEPPPTTVFIVLAEDVPEELVTIASRCVRVEFGPIPSAAVAARLREEGASSEVAEAAAASAGGDLDRARLLVTDPALESRRRFWRELPRRLDGTGAAVATLVAEIGEQVDGVLAPLQERQAAELAAATEEAERFGGRKGVLKEIDERHKREVRRIRMDELRSGLAALAASYRDSAATGGSSAAFVQAGAAIGEVCERLVYNPNERLALESLLVGLPFVADG